MDLRIIEIADHYGKREEILKCMEELDELKWALERGDDPNAVEEIADVFITLCEQVYLRGCGDKVKLMVDAKLKRQIKRMEDERNESRQTD